MSNPAIDLETVSTDDLIAELKVRSSAMIVVIQPRINRDFYWGHFSKGPLSEILLLMEKAKTIMMQQCLKDTLMEIKDEAATDSSSSSGPGEGGSTESGEGEEDEPETD